MTIINSGKCRAALLVALLGALGLSSAVNADSAIYGGGPFYNGGTAVMNDLRASGFTTVMLWSIHVAASGDLHINDEPLISNGTFVGTNANWSAQLKTLKQAPTSIKRIEVSIGAGSVPDFERIEAIINGTGPGAGTGTDSTLYKNFKLLKSLTGADAANFDDESAYDLPSATAFGKMLAGLGYKVTFAPYEQQPFWVDLKKNLGASVDRIYLQVYDGGKGNDPVAWSKAFGMAVEPGLWSRHGKGCTLGDDSASVHKRMSAWKAGADIPGGFMWDYDDIKTCSAAGGTPADYARAINSAVGH